MGWPRIGKAGVSTRVAGVSFRALDERGVEGSARGAGGSPAGLCRVLTLRPAGLCVGAVSAASGPMCVARTKCG
jgi:hypothetical protein